MLPPGPMTEGGDEAAGGAVDDNADVVVGPGPGTAAPAPTPSTADPPTLDLPNIPPPQAVGFVPHPTELNRE